MFFRDYIIGEYLNDNCGGAIIIMMRKNILLIAFALSLVLFQGCGVKKNVQSLDNFQKNEGLVVGTLRVEINGKDVSNNAGIFFDNKSFGTLLNTLSPDGFFAFNFEEGIHLISMVNYYEGYPTVPIENGRVGYSFEVQAGKANYLGNITVKWTVNQDIFKEPPGSMMKPKYAKYTGRDLGSVTIETSYNKPEQITRLLRDKYGDSFDIITTEMNENENPNNKDRQGFTPLMHAAAEGSLNVARDLIAKNADVNEVDDKNGYSALFHAIINEKSEIAEFLLESGADPNVLAIDGVFPLAEAGYRGMYSTVRKLIDYGATIDKRNAIGLSALFATVNQDKVQVAELLLDNGADPDIHLTNGSAMLLETAIENRIEMARVLLDNGANVNIRNNVGTTALMYASSKGHIEMVKLLLEHGADPSIAENGGGTALLFANQNGFVTIAEYIKSSIKDNTVRTNPITKPVSIVTYQGTGWVTVGGYIVTNYHVIENYDTISIRFNSINDEEYQAKVVVSDKSNDLAILKLVDSSEIIRIPGLPITSTFPSPGESVFTLGYPKSSIMGRNPKVTDGIVSALSGIQDDPTVMQITVPIQSGNSGGPLINMKGDVVGVTTATLGSRITERGIDVPQNVNYAVKTAYVNVLLSSLQIDNSYPIVKVTGDNLATIVPQVQNAIVQIIVQAKP